MCNIVCIVFLHTKQFQNISSHDHRSLANEYIRVQQEPEGKTVLYASFKIQTRTPQNGSNHNAMQQRIM